MIPEEDQFFFFRCLNMAIKQVSDGEDPKLVVKKECEVVQNLDKDYSESNNLAVDLEDYTNPAIDLIESLRRGFHFKGFFHERSHFGIIPGYRILVQKNPNDGEDDYCRLYPRRMNPQTAIVRDMCADPVKYCGNLHGHDMK